MKAVGTRQLIHWFILISMLVMHVCMAYFTERSDSVQLISLFGGLTIFWFLSGFDLRIRAWQIIVWGMIFRAVYLFASPELSEDVYRYLWDGALLVNGMSPYAFTPVEAIASHGSILDSNLFDLLNSKQYYSVYPPVQQWIYAFVMWVAGGDFKTGMLVLKAIILAFEFGSMWLILQLLRQFGKTESHLILYAFCPLIIIEYSGNMHGEVIMIFFLLLMAWWMKGGRVIPAAVAFSGAVLTKLLPLMFLPIILVRIGWTRSYEFVGITAVITLFGFQPFVDAQLIANISDSLGKYYTNFEFNGSVYYLVRWLGSLWLGYNPIASIGLALPIITGLLILWTSWKKRDASEPILGVFAIIWLAYYLLSTTVNPWYIAVLVPLSIFSNSKAAWIWVATIPLSYMAFWGGGVEERTWILLLEYLLVYPVLAIELNLLKWLERKWALRKAEVKWNRLSDLYQPNEKVLDVGSGSGAFVKLLNDRGISVNASDVKDSSLFSDVKPIQLNESGISQFKDDGFDCVQMITMLHHTDDPDRLIKQASQVAPRLIVMEDVFSNPWQEFVTHITDSIVNWEFFGHPHTNRTDEDWKAIFERAGYELKATTSEQFLWFFRQNVYVLERTE